ncbi:MAG TPA: TadE family protein [Pyrinomonadaceae bacterium]|nr:TadE family protein [Pyrinomonadaceae bacterium]
MRRKEMLRKVFDSLRREEGSALAELAIMVPLILVMMAAVCEFGRYFQNYNTLSKATRSSARYLSNHPLTAIEIGRAQNLVVCGKLTCAAGDARLVPGLAASNVCIESSGSPKVTNVTVRIPRPDNACNPMAGAPAATPFTYTPIFNIGALLGTSFSFALPIAPRTTMYYMID